MKRSKSICALALQPAAVSSAETAPLNRSDATQAQARPRLPLSSLLSPLSSVVFLLLLTPYSLLLPSPAHAQLPATPPTTAAPAATAAQTAPIAATSDPTPTRPHHAEVTFADGQLTVRANDSSLRQILSTLARITGMAISGGVADQRVYGSYGPGDASTILATLLDGTGVNMFIREDDAHSPTTLVLTPRSGSGGSPISAEDDRIGLDAQVPSATPQQPMQPSQPVPSGQPAQSVVSGPPFSPAISNNPLGSPGNTTPTASQIPTTNSVPTDTLPTPTTATQTQQGIVDSPNSPPEGQAAGGPLTPEQIYQKLLDMQKAKAAAGTGATTPQ